MEDGRRIVAERLTARAIPIEHFMSVIDASPPVRVPGTAVFMTAQPRGTPPALAHNLRHNKVMHEYVVILTVRQRRCHTSRRRNMLPSRTLGSAST